jgi:hypothetical protein
VSAAKTRFTEGSLCALMDFQGTWRHVDKVIEALLINCDKATTFLLLCTRLPPNCHCLLDFLFIRCTSCAATTVLILFTCPKAFFGGINGVSCSLIIIASPSLQWMRFFIWWEKRHIDDDGIFGKFPFFTSAS